MPKPQFEPISLTGYNEDALGKNGSKNYRIHFSLSDKPTPGWEKCFVRQRKSRRKQNAKAKAKAYVRKNELVLITSLDDLGFHFANLKEDVDAANTQHLEHLNQKNEKMSEKKRKREEKLMAEKRAIHEALERLTWSNP